MKKGKIDSLTLHQHATDPVLCTVDADGIATLTLNRPHVHNAFDNHSIATLLDYLNQLSALPMLRLLVLRANGRHFSAGADLGWMQSMITISNEENIKDANQLADLLHTLDTFPTPTIALIQGYAYGGALGLICCCDIAIASRDARFCFSEVKIGLIPATIAPYVCRSLGQRQARRYMLTAEIISAHQATHLNLIHRIVATSKTLDDSLQHHIDMILTNSPNAMRKAKVLCKACETDAIDAALRQKTAQMMAEIRTSPEGQEGLNAFLAKRLPEWNDGNE
ncbi:enoyl-CoA hydratase-related protein [Photobacterium nomapromontoriensis]|uniref:enoyl-CoA hydratase-related protein n=1 Tax=Photobacterium nomapromontoriensis TaxID=2910237 RepID=UPI003D0B70E0